MLTKKVIGNFYKNKTMKVKLLKKVRKRYSIERIDFVNDRFIIDNPNSMITHYALTKCFPIYQLIDNIRYDTYTSIDYQTIYDKLLESIRKSYVRDNKKKNIIKITKIWYNENKL